MQWFRGLVVIACSVLSAAALRFREDGSFTILHISDVHFVDPNTTESPCPTERCGCYDLTPAEAQWPCSSANTTSLIRRLIAAE